jgi:hypothetical protein
MGMFKGLRHLEFINGVQTLPLFIPLILDVLHASPLLETLSIENCCVLPDPDTCVPSLLCHNLRRLRATSDAVSKIPPPHRRAPLYEYRDSSFLLRSCGNLAKRPLLPTRGSPLDQLFGWNPGRHRSLERRHHVRQDEELPRWSHYHRREGYSCRGPWAGRRYAATIFPPPDQHVRCHVLSRCPQVYFLSFDHHPRGRTERSPLYGCRRFHQP